MITGMHQKMILQRPMLNKLLLFCMTIWGVSTLAMKKKNTLEAFSAIATAYETALFEYQPELGLFWGKSDVALDRFMDSSIEG